MRVILENETAKSSRHLVLSPGQFMRIGSRAAELTGQEDRFMSSMHFLVECKADRCRIADMGSKNGTFVNGTRITDAILHDGDLILAGQTRFRVHIDAEEGAKPPAGKSVEHFTSSFGDETMVLRQEAKDLRDVLYEHSGLNLYALLDSTQDGYISELLRESREQYQPVFENHQENHQGDSWEIPAPYLVELLKGSPLLTILITEGWGKSWGIYFTSAALFPEVCRHFRHLLTVPAEDNDPHFRLYDAQVLRTFLPACDEGERKRFFGPVQHIMVEEDGGSAVLRFSAAATGTPEEIKVRAELKDKRRRVTDLLFRKGSQV